MTDDGIARRQEALDRLAAELGVPAPVWTEQDEARYQVWVTTGHEAAAGIRRRKRPAPRRRSLRPLAGGPGQAGPGQAGPG
ncbi:hypothetical protein ACTI_63110 [Actinoplanes sp. OR16]|nr:hypothetical protein ACTI_63110 [Actinoplanes sp. OR16]